MTSIPGWEDVGDLPGGGITRHLVDPSDLFHELSGATAHAAREPKRRWSHEARGKVLYFPRTGMVMVPFELHRDRSWSCVVVFSREPAYPVGGYHLSVSAAEIETAVELSLAGPIQMARITQVLSRFSRSLQPITPEEEAP